jgi:hypothetical protein
MHDGLAENYRLVGAEQGRLLDQSIMVAMAPLAPNHDKEPRGTDAQIEGYRQP